MKMRKPKIGLLALMTDGYESIFPGINERQFKYAKELVKSLSSVADITFNEIGCNRAVIEKIVKEFEGTEDKIKKMINIITPCNQSGISASANCTV